MSILRELRAGDVGARRGQRRNRYAEREHPCGAAASITSRPVIPTKTGTTGDAWRFLRVLADPEAHAPKLERPANNQPAPPSVVELLKVLLKAKSDNAGVAAKLIATVSDLEKIALNDNADVEAMKGWRRQLFGEDALKLKRGEIALVLNGARVEVVEIEG